MKSVHKIHDLFYIKALMPMPDYKLPALKSTWVLPISQCLWLALVKPGGKVALPSRWGLVRNICLPCWLCSTLVSDDDHWWCQGGKLALGKNGFAPIHWGRKMAGLNWSYPVKDDQILALNGPCCQAIYHTTVPIKVLLESLAQCSCMQEQGG